MQNETLTEKQSFCPECGRNFLLENRGTQDKPIWVMPQHVVRKHFSKATTNCKGSNLNMN